MHHKTQAIVLSVSRYSDTFSVAHVFTRDFGRVAYLLPKKGGKKSKLKPSLFFPLSLLQLEVEHLPLREIQRLKDAERLTPLHDVCTDVVKTSVVFFVSEFLSKVLRETHENELVFDFLRNSVETLEELRRGTANFHPALMFGLTRFLGIYPNLENYRNGACFDMINAEFVSVRPAHNHFLDARQSAQLKLLQRMNYSNMHLFKFSRSERNALTDHLLTYYRLHVYDFSPLKSLDVLRELF